MGERPWSATATGVVVAVRLTPKSGRDSIDGIETLSDGRNVLKARGLAERAHMFSGVFEDSRQILMGDREIAIDLRDQRRVELLVPADDGNAQEQRKDNKRRQKRDGEKSETDRPAQGL